jgi:hypothetical protein
MNKFEKFCIAVIGFAIVCIALAFFTTGAVSANEGTVAPELEGTWRVTLTPASPNTPIQVFHTFTRGGVMMESNSSDRSLTGSQTPGHGVWRRTGPHTFAFTFEKLQFDLAGNFVGKLKVREAIQLNQRLDSYNGIGQAMVFDSSGTLLFSFCVRSEASRMRVETPECP